MATASRSKPRRCHYKREDWLTFFRSAARGLHVTAELTRETTRREARKRRANKRPRVGCCEELARRIVANVPAKCCRRNASIGPKKISKLRNCSFERYFIVGEVMCFGRREG